MVKLCFFLFTLGFPLSAAAQLRYGLKGGINLAGISHNAPAQPALGTQEESNAVAGFTLGGIVDLSLSNAFFLQSGINYGRKGGYLPDASGNGRVYRYGDLEVPLYVGVNLNRQRDDRLYIAAGPYLGSLMGGKGTVDFGYKAEMGMIWDWGAGFHIGYSQGLSNYYQIGSKANVYGNNIVINLGLTMMVAWNKTIRERNQHVKRGEYDKALVQAEEYLQKKKGEYINALKNPTETAWIAERAADYVVALEAAGDVCYLKKDYVQAQHYYAEAVATREAYPAYKNLFSTSVDGKLTQMYYQNGNSQEAEKRLLEAVQVWRTEEIQQRGSVVYNTFLAAYLGTYYQLIQFYINTGRYDEAEIRITEVLSVENHARLPIISKPIAMAIRLKHCASFYADMGASEKAETLFLQALALMKEEKGEVNANYVLIADYLADLYWNTNQHAKAELLVQQTLSSLQQHRNDALYSYYLGVLANRLGLMGRLAEAEAILLETVRFFEKKKGKENVEVFQYLPFTLSLTRLYTESGRFQEAEAIALKVYRKLKEYQSTREKQGDHKNAIINVNYSGALEQLAVINLGLGRFEQAKVFALEDLAFVERMYGKKEHYAISLNLLAGVYLRMGQFNQAEKLYKQSLQIKRIVYPPNDPVFADSFNLLGRLYYQMGQLDSAYHYYQRSNAFNLNYMHKDSQYRYLSEKEKEAFFTKTREWIDAYNSFYLRYYPQNASVAGLMYNNALTTKGLIFGLSKQVAEKSLKNPDLLNQYKRWQDQKNFLAKVYQMSKEEKQRFGIEEAKLEREVNQAEKELTLKSASIGATAQGSQLRWEDIQKELKIGEAAVEILRHRKYISQWTDTVEYVALVIKPNQALPVLVTFDNGKEMEEEAFQDYQRFLDRKDQTGGLQDSYKRFWQPIAKHLQGSRKIYFSPDGVYHKINLSTLINPVTGKYLLEEIEIRQVSSTRELTRTRSRPSREGTVKEAWLFGNPAYNLHSQWGVGNDGPLSVGLSASIRSAHQEKLRPLPETQTELEYIGRVLSSNGVKVQQYLGTEATEEAIKEISSPSVLVVGTHGYFLANVDDHEDRTFAGFDTKKFIDNPLLRSGVHLAGAQSTLDGKRPSSEREDGILTAYEAMNLDLSNTELVVLSACETGLGAVKNGEGVYGLQRAFQTAGAKTLIMSLWKVDDKATRELMTTFFENWMKVKNKRQAFLAAQMTIKAKYKLPYYWGAFVLLGE